MATSKGLNFTKEELQELYDLGLSNTKIAEIYGVERGTIFYWSKKLGIKSKRYAKPIYVEDFFDKINSKEKAYMLGFLLGDGAIDKIGNLECSIAMADKEVLYHFKDWTGCNVVENNKTNIKTRSFPHASIHIANRHMMEKLKMLFGGRLKPERHIPIIPKQYESYLVQGFFDADGCVTFGHRKDRGYLWKKIIFTSQLKMLTGIQSILDKQGISSKIYPKSHEKCYVLELSRNTNNVLKALNYIYSDEDFVILKRKYKKAQALRLELGENGEGHEK